MAGNTSLRKKLRNIFIREEEDGYFVTEFPLLLTIGHNITVHFLPVDSFRQYAIELFPSFISLFLSFYFVQMFLCLPRFTNTGDFFSFVLPPPSLSHRIIREAIDRRSWSFINEIKTSQPIICAWTWTCNISSSHNSKHII